MLRRALARHTVVAGCLVTLLANAFPARALDAQLGSTSTLNRQDSYYPLRRTMVEKQIRRRGIDDRAVLQAMEEVPRHLFVTDPHRSDAYADMPLPINDEQVLHQPYLVALMTDLLEIDKSSKVLEIGTGSGYHTAVLAWIAGSVFSIEIDPNSAREARGRMKTLGAKARSVHIRTGDGYQGWSTEAPFDAILMTTAPPFIPQPLLDQLKVGGRMVVPEGRNIQDLIVLTKTEEGYEKRKTIPVRVRSMSGEIASDDP